MAMLKITIFYKICDISKTLKFKYLELGILLGAEIWNRGTLKNFAVWNISAGSAGNSGNFFEKNKISGTLGQLTEVLFRQLF